MTLAGATPAPPAKLGTDRAKAFERMDTQKAGDGNLGRDEFINPASIA